MKQFIVLYLLFIKIAIYLNFMKVLFLVIGKTDKKYLIEGIDLFIKRVKRYISFEMSVIPDIKGGSKLPEAVQKEREGELILSKLLPSDKLILLDDKGKELSSVDFANYMQKEMLTGVKRLVFVVGGPYGFSSSVYGRADGKLSLSKMTFSHQMVRLIFVEQLYRAMTILKNEPYHHI